MGKGIPRSLAAAGIDRDADRGTPSGTGVSLAELDAATAGVMRQEKITLTDVDLAMVDNAAVVAHTGLKVYDFPAGLILFQGAVMDLALTKSSAGVNDTWDGDIALGTVVADTGATLATTEQDLVPTTATPQAVSGVTTGDAQSTATESGALLDGTSTAVDVFLNLLVDDADHDVTTTPCNIIVNGTITLLFSVVGDN